MLVVYMFAIYFAVCQTAAGDADSDSQPEDNNYYMVPLMEATKIEFELNISNPTNTFVCFSSVNNESIALLISDQHNVCSNDIINISRTTNDCKITINETENTHDCKNISNIHIHIEFETGERGDQFTEETGDLNIRSIKPDQLYIYTIRPCNLGSDLCESSPCLDGWACENFETYYACTSSSCTESECENCNGVNKNTKFICGEPCSYNHLGLKCNPRPSNSTSGDCCFLSITEDQKCSSPTESPEVENGFTVFTTNLIMQMVFTGTAVLVLVIGCICVLMAFVTKPSNRIKPTGEY
ncbi:uncharacterized protein LOC117103871 [Anneissia japonica]|uniref:uncharacterized protein LOC117103871 n=1 Tax=Anneissia japonica TaxID=1529436 RepID=UPI001425A042|nr:uncharacterized protein LOC117103871 [Anneissia japonica]